MIKRLSKFNLDIQDIRGQEYDNGANMRGNRSKPNYTY